MLKPFKSTSLRQLTFILFVVILFVGILLFSFDYSGSSGAAIFFFNKTNFKPVSPVSLMSKFNEYYLTWVYVNKKVENITDYSKWVLLFNESSQKYYYGENTSTYDTYFMPNKNFRVVCQQPCPIPEVVLRKKVLGVNTAINKLTNLIKIDVLNKSKPVDIHLTKDIVCDKYNPLNAAGISGAPKNSSFICSWEWEKNNSFYPINPAFLDSNLTKAQENARKIEAQFLVMHEYGHIIFYDRTYVQFEFMGAWAAYTSGLKDNLGETHLITSACDPMLEFIPEGGEAYLLCTKCNFDFKDHNKLLTAIDNLYTSDGGKPRPGFSSPYPVGKSQMKQICDQVVGKDCVKDCGLSSDLLEE